MTARGNTSTVRDWHFHASLVEQGLVPALPGIVTQQMAATPPELPLCSTPNVAGQSDIGASSVHGVFGVFELAEKIFQHVDGRTLLTSVQRVHSKLRDVVVNSSALRRKLFFEPHNLEQERLMSFPKASPLASRRLPGLTYHPHHSAAEGGSLQRGRRSYLGSAISYVSLNGVGSRLSGPSMLLGHVDTCSRERFTRKDASWRKMQFSQPAVRKVNRSDWSSNSRRAKTVEFPTGLTMGELFDVLFLILHKTRDGVCWGCWRGQQILALLVYRMVTAEGPDLTLEIISMDDGGGNKPCDASHCGDRAAQERAREMAEDRESLRCEDFDADAVALAFDDERVVN
ncbi:hypothetical protein QBC34DRAFT_83419 [Podospora aff. communis PSN243]|uniref:F-box domain-containing protein n=1 Tax=Podospora aff. communis PSN243 TaxID=3040156 RepID=A0AAV9GLY0_9PEZI|nr:hypothetical protein QBC34DRAFT_83419 [Podospora aff. communis PSN243]